ncbi:MAG: Gfo/Idh/MocA family protein [Candidatus Dormibacteraceae bacterium]
MSEGPGMRVGMISWAHVHAEFRAKALSEIPGARIVAIADEDESRGRAAAGRFGVEWFSTDWRRLVELPDVDVVMVHSENSRHADQVVAAAAAGKHVFCEKPIATSARDAERMVEAVRRAGVQGTAAFVSRFSQEATRAKRILETGVLGEIVNARALIGLAGIAEIGCPPDMVAWMVEPARGGGGAWIDEGSHAVDLLSWMVGDIVEVSAFLDRRVKRDLEVEDIGVALLRFADGALGEVTTSWSLAIDLGMRNVLEVYGSKGALYMEATSRHPRVELYTEALAPELRGWVSPHIRPEASEPHDYGGWPPHVHHYKREVSSYVARYLAGERPFGPSLEDGRACLEVLLAGYRSAADGRSVHLPKREAADLAGRNGVDSAVDLGITAPITQGGSDEE